MLEKYYNKVASAQSLASIQASRGEDRPLQTQVRELVKIPNWEDLIEVSKLSGPPAWRITWQREGMERNEVVFHIQAVVEDRRLLPLRLSKGTKKGLNHFRQSITVSGLGGSAFREDLNAIIEVYAVLARAVGNVECFPIKGGDGREMLEVGNRVFTPKREASSMQWVAPQPEADPEMRITKLVEENSSFTHGADNVVDYGEEKDANGGGKRTSVIAPHKIQIGDIVDVAFAIIAVPTQPKAKALLILRGVTILDPSHTQACFKASARCGPQLVPQYLLKRRAAFDEDAEGQVEEARKKMRDLVLGENLKMDLKN